MVSAIIPNNNQTKYLYRCINALKRQTYKDIQIIVITNQEIDLSDEEDIEIIKVYEDSPFAGLNRALRIIKGDFLLFCNITSVLSSNVVERMIEESFEEPDLLDCAYYYEMKGASCNLSKYDYTTILGKLFSKKIIDDNNIVFNEESELCLFYFLAQYYKNIQGKRFIDCAIYDSECEKTDVSLIEQTAEGEIWTGFLDAIAGQEKEIGDSFCDEFCNRITDDIFLSEDVVNVAEAILHDKYAFQKTIILPTIKKWWNDIKDYENTEKYSSFVSYLVNYADSEEYQSLLLNECGLSKDQLTILQKYDYHDALFFIVNYPKSEDIKEKEFDYSRVLNKLDALKASNEALEAILRLNGIEIDSEKQRVFNGVRDGLVKLEKNWFYFQNGEIDFNYRGLAKNQFGWFYVNNGVIDSSYNGVVTNRFGAWCVENGRVDKQANGYRKVGNTEAFFVDGKVNQSVEGLVLSNEKWKYYKQGIVDKSFRGLIENDNKLCYIENGTINIDFEGLVEYEGNWRFVKNGFVDNNYEGYALNKSGWHYVKNGALLYTQPNQETNHIEMVLNRLETVLIQQEIAEKSNNMVEELQGEKLEKFAVDKYSEGQLGFRTIWKSLGAWIKYKL